MAAVAFVFLVSWIGNEALLAVAVAPPSAGDLATVDVAEAVARAGSADDECGADGIEGCAFSAMQRRSAVTTATGGAAALEADGNNSRTWPFSASGSTYTAKCFSNMGADACGPSMASGSCVCPKGCMGADGSCYDQENKLLADGFELSSAQWPDYKMYVQRMSVFGQMKTTSTSASYNLGQDKFRLYELPGKLDGQRQFFLASAKWDDYVLSIAPTAGTAFSLWGAYSVSLAKKHRPWNLQEVMLRVCSARKSAHPDAVMIGTSVTQAGSTIWAYVKGGSYFVYGYWYPEAWMKSKILPGGKADAPAVKSAPDVGGLWVPSPPLPRGLVPDC